MQLFSAFGPVILIFSFALLGEVISISMIPKEDEKLTNKTLRVEDTTFKDTLIVSSTTIAVNSSVPDHDPILPEWGGNCTQKDWKKCSSMPKGRYLTNAYVDVKKKELGFKPREMDCTIQPVLCLKNGWTVTRCQLLCMKCNKELISKYDKYVVKEGMC